MMLMETLAGPASQPPPSLLASTHLMSAARLQSPSSEHTATEYWCAATAGTLDNMESETLRHLSFNLLILVLFVRRRKQ